MPRLFGCALPLLQPGPAHQTALTPAGQFDMRLMPFVCLHNAFVLMTLHDQHADMV